MNGLLFFLCVGFTLILSSGGLLRAATDYNGDGYDDVWQQLYGVTLAEFPMGSDNDGDGCANGVEAVAGTNPRNASDCIKVGNTAIAGSNVVLYVLTEKGKRYQLQSSNAPGGPVWADVNGGVTGDDTVKTFQGPMGAGNTRYFYRVETEDQDSDGDGVSDWAEGITGTDPMDGSSDSNASGGVASDGDTLHSLLTVTAAPLAATGFEKEGTPASVRLTRTYGAMPLKLPYGVLGNPDLTKGAATVGDISVSGAVGQTITIPAGASTHDVVINPVSDSQSEVPELLRMAFTLPGVPATAVAPVAAVTIKDATVTNANRRLYVAYLGREEGVSSTATGIATALVEGDNDSALVSLTFSNLTSEQNTAYIRIGNDLEVFRIPNGQVSGQSWSIRASQILISDQAALDALASGSLYVSISSATYLQGEIKGYFQLSTGSTEFDPDNPNLVPPAYVSPTGPELDRDIYRFLTQATYGPTTKLYNEVKAEVDAAVGGGGTALQGYASWLDKQLNPAQTPSIDFSTLVMAADNEEFVIRGNKAITAFNDPQFFDNLSFNVTYDANGKPVIGGTNGTYNNNYPAGAVNRRREWWSMILQCKDQVRQRMALALSEILVISELDQTVNDRHYGAAEYWDMLAQGASGKYRNLLEKVTLSPMMGVYLSHIGNRQAYDADTTAGVLIVSPDENYAREIMQLFSIGLVLRHPDGSLVLGPDGLPIATYDQADITELARVMTGFSHGARHANTMATNYNGVTLTTSNQAVSPVLEYNTVDYNAFGRNDQNRFFPGPWMNPMKVIGKFGTTVYHDFDQKTLFAGKHKESVLPAQVPTSDAQSHVMAANDITLAHNALAGAPGSDSGYDGHQNTPVNISRWLIQRFTTSNPSAGYIYRVSEAYRQSNGNLGEVVKAILLDYEARSLSLADSAVGFGKLKEPMVHFASILRGLKAFSGAPISNLKNSAMTFATGESPLTTPYPESEFQKFDAPEPPSLPAGWASGPFRYRFGDTSNNFGQSPQKPPSVFNWFLPDYVVPGPMAQAGLFAPEMQIATETIEVNRVNWLWTYTWANLVGMSTQPGTDSNVSDFIINSGNASRLIRADRYTLTFDSTNWNTAQTVGLSALNDRLMEGTIVGSLTHTVTSTDPAYNNVSGELDFSITDNEVPNTALIVAQTGANTAVAEGGITDSFTVRLSSPPTANVTVSLSTSTQVTLSAASLVFTPASWATAQTVTVTAANDGIIEGTHSASIAFATVSSSSGYQGLTVPPVAVTVYDNDGGTLAVPITIQGVVTTQSSGSTWVAEPPAGTTDTFTIAFSAPLAADITLNVTGPTDVAFSPTSVTFTTANWSVPQTITVSATDDTTSEGNEAAVITMRSTLNNNHTFNLNPNAMVVDNDNATGGVLIREVASNTNPMLEVTEGTGMDTYQVALTRLPTGTVTYTATAVSQVQVSLDGVSFGTTAMRTFTTGNWATPQTITVRAIDDTTRETSPHNGNITHSVSGGGYTAAVQALLPSVTDNEGNVIIAQSGTDTRVQEGGFADTYTLALDRAPLAGSPVTVTVVSPTQVLVTPGEVTFTDANWNTPQTVTVTAIDDNDLDGLQTVPISHYFTSTDTRFRTVANTIVGTVNVDALDNEGGQLLLTQSGGSTDVSEEGDLVDTYAVTLTQAPSSDVTVTLTIPPAVANFTTQLSISPATMTFTPANWNTAQTVTVAALDDTTTEGVHASYVLHTVSSNDRVYGGAPAQTLGVNIVDDEAGGVIVRQTSGGITVTEGAATDTLGVCLPTQPTGNVTVTLTVPDSQSQIWTGATPASASVSLTFSNANWATPQTVNVRGLDDAAVESSPHAGVINVAVTSSSAGYNTLVVPPVPVEIVDNDSAAISIVENTTFNAVNGVTAATEGATDSVVVVLTRQPTANVTLTFAADAETRINSAPSGGTYVASATRTFTTSNWNVAQNVNIQPFNDNTVESMHSGAVTCVASSTDAAYQGATGRTIVTTISDNDGRIRITENTTHNGGVSSFTGVNYSLVQESANFAPNTQGADTYTVVLTAPLPGSNVTVNIDGGSQLLVSTPVQTVPGQTATLTFTPANYSTAQTVTVRAANDAVIEGNHAGMVTHTSSSADANFNGIVIPNVNVAIGDNDRAQVVLLPSEGSTVVKEGGATDSYRVLLSAQPSADVSVTAGGGAQLSVSPAGAMTFTAANWDVPQLVTATAVNDSTAETTQVAQITHSLSSTDASFNIGTADSLAVTVQDNDGAQLVLTPMNVAVPDTSTVLTEVGGTDTYSVRLSQQPAAGTTVTVTITPPMVVTTVPAYTKQMGYFTNDFGSSNQQKDRIVLDYTEAITLYMDTFYGSLTAAYAPDPIPATPGTALVRTAHWEATKAIVDRMDLWWCGGSLRAKFPTLIETYLSVAGSQGVFNPRQTIVEGVFNGYSTTRYAAQFAYNPGAPPTDAFYNELRDRCRIAAYLISLSPNAITLK